MKINVGERACLPLSPFLCKERDVKRIIEDGFVLEREGKSGLLTVLIELEVAIIAFVLFFVHKHLPRYLQKGYPICGQ